MRKVVAITVALAGLACGSEGPSPGKVQPRVLEGTAPSLTGVDIGAGPFTKLSILAATVGGWYDADGDEPRYLYQWYANELPIAGQTADSLSGAYFNKGDAIFVQVTPLDANHTGTPVNSNTVVIENSAPSIAAAAISNPPFTRGSTLAATAFGWADPDGDTEGYQYVWFANGIALPGQSGAALAGTFQKGDAVSVQVTPFDGTLAGPAQLSAGTVIGDSAPAITSVVLDANQIPTGVLTAAVQSSDADGDPLAHYYQWWVNGMAAGVGPSLPLSSFPKGVTLAVSAVAGDGSMLSSPRLSNIITKTNTPPQITAVAIGSDQPKSATLTPAIDAADIDGDAIGFTYAWWLNGAMVASGGSLALAAYSRGDTVAVTVTPSDGDDSGASFLSNTMTILNMPPTAPQLSLHPAPVAEGASLWVTLDTPATDADADPITYTYAWFKNGVDQGFAASTTGVPAATVQSGERWSVVVTADDGFGGAVTAWSGATIVPSTAPQVTSLSPGAGGPGAYLSILGEHFGPIPAGTVTIGGKPAPIETWSDTHIIARVPDTIAPGAQPLQVTVNGTSNAVLFGVTASIPLGLADITPRAGRGSAVLTLSGTGFGAAQGASTVYVGGAAAAVLSWSNTQIEIFVPGQAPSGWVGVNVKVPGAESNVQPFEHQRPWLLGRSPALVETGTVVTLEGRYLGSVAGTAAIAGQSIQVTGWYSDRITGIVQSAPEGPQAIYAQTSDAAQTNSLSLIARGNDLWATDGVPSYRHGHTAVWTGSQMIVWGGKNESGDLDSGGRYDPVTHTWVPASRVGAPAARRQHSAVWTGTEMIVWGGTAGDSGGRYDPASDSWQATSLSGAPSARSAHTAVWTGTHMIVWGGNGADSGGRYDPVSDTWQATSLTGAPSGRSFHTAVWTGTHMIVWGGASGSPVNTGARYDPATDTWQATNLDMVPTAREKHTAVWTGAQMVVWGGWNGTGTDLSGGRYDPVTDSWSATSLIDAPETRQKHTAVWTGLKMVVWGGEHAYYGWDDSLAFSHLDSGGAYDPATNRWSAANLADAPMSRSEHTAVWTGTHMAIWGGWNGTTNRTNSVSLYEPHADSWSAPSLPGVPVGRHFHTAVWAGAQMIVWGGSSSSGLLNSGGRYNPATDTWTPTSLTNAPAARADHSAVWTGDRMIVWGGRTGAGIENSGGRYNPATDTWGATSLTDAPAARGNHTAVWTGERMIVWGGGFFNTGYDSGGRYDPATDTWEATGTAGVPEGRLNHTAVWAGDQMIVWGGENHGMQLATGARYDAGSDTWTPTATTDAPEKRRYHSAVWTGSQMIVWGGLDGGNLATGGRYAPASDTWLPVDTAGAPDPRRQHAAVWAGSRMIIWGGYGDDYLDTGGQYDPLADSWLAMNTTDAPARSLFGTAVWTGSRMLVWGGEASGIYFNSVGTYFP